MKKDMRRTARYPVVGLAAIEVIPSLQSLEGYVANFGKSGVGLYVRDPLAPGDHVHISLSIDNIPELRVDERYQGNVVWVNQVGSVYAVGVEFVDETDGCKAMGSGPGPKNP